MLSSDKAEPSTVSAAKRIDTNYKLFSRIAQVNWKWIMVLTDDEHGVIEVSVLQHELIHMEFARNASAQRESVF